MSPGKAIAVGLVGALSMGAWALNLSEGMQIAIMALSPFTMVLVWVAWQRRFG